MAILRNGIQNFTLSPIVNADKDTNIQYVEWLMIQKLIKTTRVLHKNYFTEPWDRGIRWTVGHT